MGSHRLLRNFLAVVVDHGRISSIREIAGAVEAAVDDRLGRGHASVAAAPVCAIGAIGSRSWGILRATNANREVASVTDCSPPSDPARLIDDASRGESRLEAFAHTVVVSRQNNGRIREEVEGQVVRWSTKLPQFIAQTKLHRQQ